MAALEKANVVMLVDHKVFKEAGVGPFATKVMIDIRGVV